MSDAFSLRGQRILITGAAGGIGAATARVCAELGAVLFLTDVRSCDPLALELREAGTDASAQEADLGDAAAADRLAAWADPVDAAIFCAGLYRPVDWFAADWESVTAETLASNLLAPMRLARAFGERMVRRGSGRLIFVGSIAATSGGSFPGVGPHYAVSKGGLHTLVRWCAARFAPHVLASGVAPGVTDTPMLATHDLAPALAKHPMGRTARPEEVAGPVAFLCTPAASFISGAIIDVNGGSMMRP